MPYTDEVDNQELLPWETMAWSEPHYSRGKVDAAGELLAHPRSMFDADHDIAGFYGEAGRVVHVVNDWRASHNLPLYVIRKTLEKRAKRISEHAIVAQRIKRLPSIKRKLRENEFRHLKLSQIQDIGGCRAIMPEIDDVLCAGSA